MPSWNELLNTFEALPPPAGGPWLLGTFHRTLLEISKLRADRNVLFYGTAFLQKPGAPQPSLIITSEDVNGLMSVFYGMDCSKGLTLILHTPGGVTNAAETMVAYLRSKFTDIEVIIPTYAMSAGTMISLSANRVIMGRQSQMGPIDPQFSTGAKTLSARAVVAQFQAAREDIVQNLRAAHAWAPILQSIGPALLEEAQNAIDYSEEMVTRWLATWMLAGEVDADQKAAAIAKHFSDADTHKSHGRRIDRDEARSKGVVVDDLEADQSLQDAVLTAYHLFTIIVEKSPAAKIFATHADRLYLKNVMQAGPAPTP